LINKIIIYKTYKKLVLLLLEVSRLGGESKVAILLRKGTIPTM